MQETPGQENVSDDEEQDQALETAPETWTEENETRQENRDRETDLQGENEIEVCDNAHQPLRRPILTSVWHDSIQDFKNKNLIF